MTSARWWLLAVLLVLPACFDPIVGSKCAEGYSLCGNRCVVAGTCAGATDAAPEAVTVDGDQPVDTSAATVLDGGENPADDAPSASSDVGAMDAGTAGAETGSAFDVAGPDAPAVLDGRNDTPSDAASDVADAPPADDDAPTDAPISPIPDDAAVTLGLDEAPALDSSDDGAGEAGCLDCVDAGGDEVLASVDAGESEAGIGIDGPLVCTDPSIVCNDQCVDPTTDPNNCGACDTLCATNACCNRQCTDLFVDPDNCGGCGVSCGSGLCSNGVCQAAGTGRIIALGHDYFHNRLAMNRILGNAVFLWPASPVHVLVYEGSANATAIAGADTAIAQVAAATGRQWLRTAAAATDVPAALAVPSAYSVFLIYGQEFADDSTLTQLGTSWQAALASFVDNGGTVIVLDAVYANAGTVQIVAQPGLFQIARDISATGDHCAVVTRGDALASGLPQTYLCEQNSTTFKVTDPATAAITSVVEVSGQSVVVHKVF
jgi:hypothetical protein